MSAIQKKQFLESALQKKILGAYLIVCERNEVAVKLAEEFLMRLYCKSGGCGVCSDCHKVLEGHIDIMQMSAPKVDDIREAISFVSQKAVDSEYKAIMIDSADDMNQSAANSLLKTLEEPPKNSVIILLARSAAGVLPTISSRCAIIHLSADENIKARIMQEFGVDETQAYVLTGLCGGFFEEAKRIFEDKELLKLRAKVLDICQKILDKNNYAITAHADFLESNKDNIIFALGVIQSYFHDISMLQKTKNERLIANLDCRQSIKIDSQRFTTGAISNIIKVILEAERRFSCSLNFRLAVEKMLFDILEEKNRW